MNNDYFINKETFENLEDSTQRWVIVKYDKIPVVRYKYRY